MGLDTPPLQRSAWLIDDGPHLVDPELVGHKFARQVRLAREGFPVPPLVCVPATVFDGVVRSELGPLPPAGGDGSAAQIAGTARELQERVSKVDAPEQLRAALLERFDELAGDEGLVAVRACVVPRDGDRAALAEDSAEDPFAGLSDSHLYVGRDEAVQRVVDCWASAFNPEAAVYRARRGLDPFAARVAVGVQRMAMGTRSFVAFTRDPRDGSSRCVIAAAHGIGEGVVQERADVDHFFVDPASGGIEAHVVVKSRAVGWDPRCPGQGPVEIPISPQLAAEPVLTDDQVREISALAARVERYFEVPQDIEGAITEDGAVHLVQARPVVAASRPSHDAGSPAANAARLTWDNNNVTESFPGVSCALTFSVAHELYEVGFADLYRRMGVPARVLRRNRPYLRRMIGHLNGRVYYQLDSWYRMHGQIRCFRPLWSTWEQSLGLASRSDSRRARTRGGRWALRLTAVLDVAEILARFAAHPRRVRGFLRWWDGHHAALAGAGEMSAQEAVRAYQALWAEVGRRWGVTLVNGVFLFTATWATNTLLRRWLPGADRSLLNGMLVGGPDNRSAEALHSAVALASAATANPAVRDVVMSADDPRGRWERLVPGLLDEDFAAALREHVRRYGDRGLHDLKIETVTPRDEPWTVLPTVRAFVRQGLTVESSRATGQEVRGRAERELRDRCRNPVRRAALRATFAAMRSLMRVREDTRFCRSQLFGDTRALLLRLGTLLAAAGRLDDPRDVLDLTVQEVLGSFDGTLPGTDLRGLAAVRAAERVRWSAEEPLPPRLETDPDLPLALALRTAGRPAGAAARPPGDPAREAGVLTGLASSSGTVRGTAKIVLDPSAAADECEDRVLVARETDPGWLFLMMSARALVVERGTLLSHTAITGRLLGIPTVVAVRDATGLIPDGALVEVDGAAGTVRILDGAS